MFNIFFLFSLLRLLSPEIYYFNDSVKVLIKKEGYLEEFEKKIKDKEFILSLIHI